MNSSLCSDSRQSTRNHIAMSQCSSPKYGGDERQNDALVANDHAFMSDVSGITNATCSWSIN